MDKTLDMQNLRLVGGKKGDTPTSNCLLYWDAILMCLKPKFQIIRYYRQGKVESCDGYWSDMKYCIDSHRFHGKERQEKLQRIRQHESKPLSFNVWTERDTSNGWLHPDEKDPDFNEKKETEKIDPNC